MTSARAQSPILPLTSVRFFAAWYIVLLHSVLWTDHMYTSTWMGRFLRNGYTAVSFFFVLSGYILAMVYVSADRPVQRRRFWIARFARIYPLMLFSLLLDAPVYFIDRLHDSVPSHVWQAIVDTCVVLTPEVGLLQAWSKKYFMDLNGPSWSLSAEAFFYLLFPFAAFAIWRWSRRLGLWSIAFWWGCALFFPLLVTWKHPELFVEADSSRLYWSVMLTPVFRIFEFFAGISLCSLQKHFETSVAAEMRSRWGYRSLALGVALFACGIGVANHIPLLAMSNGFLLPAFSLVIFGLVNIRGWLAFLLSHKWMVILGESSFAVYLLHSPIWDYYDATYPIETIPMWLLYCATVLAASLASFFWLERPARRWILSRYDIKPLVVQEQETVVPTTEGQCQ